MIYGIFSTIAFIIILPFWLVLGMFKPKLVYGFKEKCGFYDNIETPHPNPLPQGAREQTQTIQAEKPTLQPSNPPTLLFYGVSVGEVIAIENLIKKTRETYPQVNIVLLTGTKTGQEIAHKKLAETCNFISYFPFDFPFCIENMLNKLKPSAVFIAETELWPNFASVAHKNKIPLYIINGRISDRTYKSYKKLSFFFAPILKKYTNIFTQSKQDNEKLVSIGANPETTVVMGNLKFDIKAPDVSGLSFEKSPEDKILIAGSTHSGEDEIILEAFVELKKEFPGLKLIIAPRHPERNESVYELIKKTGLDCSKRSILLSPLAPPQEGREKTDSSGAPALLPSCLLLDTMGELGKFYSVCDIAFIGGSFNKTGGHNPLEATIFAKPTVSGPSIHNFKDIYAILTSSNAGKVVKTPLELKEHLHKLLSDEEFYKTSSFDCKKVFDENNGALGFVIDVLQRLV